LGAAADKTDHPLGLAGIEHIIDQDPKLSDQDDSENIRPNPENDRNPTPSLPKQPPEEDDVREKEDEAHSDQARAREFDLETAVKVDDEAHQDSRQEISQGQFLISQPAQVTGVTEALDDVIRGSYEEKIKEKGDGDDVFAGLDIDDAGKPRTQANLRHGPIVSRRGPGRHSSEKALHGRLFILKDVEDLG
jgi:hypothetical protein